MSDMGDTVILHQELACEDLLPVAWRPMSSPPDSALLSAMAERNVKVMQAQAALDEAGPVERPDDASPNAGDFQRLELKLNLVLELLGQIVAAGVPRPAAATVRFNSRGASWRMRAPLPAVGDLGCLDIYLGEWIVHPLTLVLRVVSVSADGVVMGEAQSPGEAVADLIERMAFRRHRRRVAGARQPRRS